MSMQELSSPSTSEQERKTFGDFLALVLKENTPKNLNDFTGKIVSVSEQPIGRGTLCLAYSGELHGHPIVVHAPVKSQQFSHPPKIKV